MRRNKIRTVLLSALFGAATAFAADSRVAEIEMFDNKLDSAFSSLQKEGVVAVTPIYSTAKGRLRKAEKAIKLKPSSKDAQIAFAICSVSAKAALLKFEREQNMAQVRKMNAKRDSLLVDLHNLHESINNLEGSRAARLSRKLEQTKAQSSQLQEDLEAQRLRNLQSQAEAAKLKESLEAERERARKLMEDAQKRFGELQSEIIKVSKDARGTIISMSDILFQSGRADLTPDLRTNLAKIAGILTIYKEPKIIVEGHTDNVGSREFNQKLSEDRSRAVLNFLVELGITQDRLSSVGYGFDRPIADNSTSEGRARNRRVDLIVQDEKLDD